MIPYHYRNFSVFLQSSIFTLYLLVDVVRVVVWFVQSEFQRDGLCLWKSDAFELPAFVHGGSIVGQRNVPQITELSCDRGIFIPRRPDLQFLGCNIARVIIAITLPGNGIYFTIRVKCSLLVSSRRRNEGARRRVKR